MQIIRLNETTAALIEIPFTSVQAANLQNRITGALAITCKIKRAGVAGAVAGAGTYTAVDDANAPGVRGYVPAVADLVLGINTFVFTAAAMEPREVPVMVVAEDPFAPSIYGTAITGTLTATQFSTSLNPGLANLYKDCLVEFLTGSLAGQVKPILASTVGPNSILTIDPTYALAGAPANNDRIRIITR